MGELLIRRLLVLSLILPLLSVAGGVDGSVAASQPTTQQGARTLRVESGLRVTLRTPAGVRAQVRLENRSGSWSVEKSDARRSRSRVLRLSPGSYRVSTPEAVSGGRLFAPMTAPKSVRVVPGRVAHLVLRWKPVTRPVQVQVTQTSPTSTTLRWRASTGSTFVVRRATGEKAPPGPRSGVEVSRGTNVNITDSELVPGTRYSYSAFVKRRRRWIGPGTVTTATAAQDAPGGAPASFALAQGSVVVDQGDSDQVEIRNGEVWVHYATSRPTPLVGAGVVLPTSPMLPAGFLGVVAEVGADNRSARLEAGSFPDVFDAFDVDTEFAAMQETLTPVASQEIRTHRRSATTGPLTPCTLGGALKVSGPSVATLTGHLRYHLTKHWGVPVAADLDFALTPGIKAGLSGAAGLKTECEVSFAKQDKVIMVGPVPTVASFRFNARVNIDVEGAASLSATAAVKLGAKLRVGKDPYFKPVFKPTITRDSVFDVSSTAKVGIGGSVTWGPGVGGNITGAAAGLYAELYPLQYRVTLQASGCSERGWGGEASAGLKAHVWAGPLTSELKQEIFQGSWDYGALEYLPLGCQDDDSGWEEKPRVEDFLAELNRARSVERWCGQVKYPAAPEMVVDDRLQSAAMQYAHRMASEDFFSHYSPEGDGPTERANAAGFPGDVGENIAGGLGSIADVVAAWLSSPGHCKNIMTLGPDVGLGFAYHAQSTYGDYWVLNGVCPCSGLRQRTTPTQKGVVG